MSVTQPARPATGLTLLPGAIASPGQRAIGLWLFAIAALILADAVVGAITRLTESGLSMVRWDPLLQDIPPLSRAAWERVFALYQQSPQYRLVTQGMTLPEFQGIFWWEWAHRLFGQAIGAVFALPFLWFLVRRQLPRRLVPYLIGLFALGGLQGLVGWLMVASGLVDRPSVSHYRLAMHLMLALTLYALTIWMGYYVQHPRGAGYVAGEAGRKLRRHAAIGIACLAVTMVWGAFTAGLRAGLLYNTFPLMGGGIVPPDFLALEPWWTNIVENPGAVQFVHRVLAMTTGLVVLALATRLRAPAMAQELRRSAAVLAADVLLQISLGIATVLTQVPVWLGALHQGNAILLLGLLIRLLFQLRPLPQPQFRPRLIVTSDAA